MICEYYDIYYNIYNGWYDVYFNTMNDMICAWNDMIHQKTRHVYDMAYAQHEWYMIWMGCNIMNWYDTQPRYTHEKLW